MTKKADSPGQGPFRTILLPPFSPGHKPEYKDFRHWTQFPCGIFCQSFLQLQKVRQHRQNHTEFFPKASMFQEPLVPVDTSKPYPIAIERRKEVRSDSSSQQRWDQTSPWPDKYIWLDKSLTSCASDQTSPWPAVHSTWCMSSGKGISLERTTCPKEVTHVSSKTRKELCMQTRGKWRSVPRVWCRHSYGSLKEQLPITQHHQNTSVWSNRQETADGKRRALCFLANKFNIFPKGYKKIHIWL